MPSFGIKSFVCVILLAMGSGGILQNSYNFHEHLNNIQTVQHDLSAPQATAQGTTEAEEKMEIEEQTLAGDKQQITHVCAKETSSSIKVANYQFPSVQERLQYYMGDWYNRSDWTVPDSDCKLLRKVNDYQKVLRDVMFHTTDFKESMSSHRKRTKAVYCRDTYDIINNALDEADSSNNHWIVSFGDRTHGIKGTLPIITKARRSALSFAPQPIVWLLNKERHYNDLESYHRDIVKKGKEVPRSEKLSKVFWRGSTTYNEKAGTSRLDYLAQWINYHDNHTDIAFSNSKVVQTNTNFKREYVKRQYVRKKQSLLEMNRYKYLLSIEGNDVATGLKWMLYSNYVVFMSRPTVATWAMEDLLVPFVHYIPLANDYSNLLEMVKWANEHDEACHEISQRATEFMEHLWLSKQAKRDTRYLQKALVKSYVNQFDDALSRCAPNTEKMANRSIIHLQKT
ncbi:hypothetical protein QTG54_008130 [Skeletonema marinoi]|uniref:Glycosyl transferase CAP10 domain-containing protein n=1 Tax=Skeletonema marinoi TaxID=267567 RepID=A0AAD9DCN9_9STRA|nr:hypothetical protein QTG54_008130 [Skeletonema marinoi]